VPVALWREDAAPGLSKYIYSWVSATVPTEGTFTHATNCPVEELYDSISYFKSVTPSPAVKRMSLPEAKAFAERLASVGRFTSTGKFVSVVPETGLTLV
jgi:hypothetical protein